MNRVTATAATLVIGAGLALGTAIPANATTDTTEVFWLLPATVTTMPAGNTPAIWPQTHLPGGEADIPCGMFAQADVYTVEDAAVLTADRKSTRLNSSHVRISYA